MKCYLLPIIGMALVATSCHSRDIAPDKVPSVVHNLLEMKYPLAQNIEWEKHEDFYEAEFKENDSTDISVRINEAGKLLMQKKDVSPAELSADIMKTLQERFKKYSVEDVERIEKDGIVYYQVELNGTTDVNVLFSTDGKNQKGIAYWD